MENQHQKFVNISYLAFAGLIAFLSFLGMMKASNAFDLESKVKSIEYIIRFASLAIGFGIFGFLYRNVVCNAFMNDVATELLTKVTWPASKDTVVATGVVIVTVLIASFILGLFDWIWTMALRWVL